jgi:hypothetical protein
MAITAINKRIQHPLQIMKAPFFFHDAWNRLFDQTTQQSLWSLFADKSMTKVFVVDHHPMFNPVVGFGAKIYGESILVFALDRQSRQRSVDGALVLAAEDPV